MNKYSTIFVNRYQQNQKDGKYHNSCVTTSNANISYTAQTNAAPFCGAVDIVSYNQLLFRPSSQDIVRSNLYKVILTFIIIFCVILIKFIYLSLSNYRNVVTSHHCIVSLTFFLFFYYLYYLYIFLSGALGGRAPGPIFEFSHTLLGGSSYHSLQKERFIGCEWCGFSWKGPFWSRRENWWWLSLWDCRKWSQ